MIVSFGRRSIAFPKIVNSRLLSFYQVNRLRNKLSLTQRLQVKSDARIARPRQIGEFFDSKVLITGQNLGNIRARNAQCTSDICLREAFLFHRLTKHFERPRSGALTLVQEATGIAFRLAINPCRVIFPGLTGLFHGHYRYSCLYRSARSISWLRSLFFFFTTACKRYTFLPLKVQSNRIW